MYIEPDDLHVRPGAWCTWELCHGGRRSQESAIDIVNHFHLNVLECLDEGIFT